jgi:NAD+ synthase
MDYNTLAQEIAGWMQAKLHEAGARGFVIGLSGGIDSATTAALCKRAAPGEVLGVWLPCHGSSEDEVYSQMAADALDIPLTNVDLSAAYDALLAALPESDVRLASANIKPRLRMAAVYYLAQANGYLVAGTGNRPELMVGFFTKWGDGGVDLEPLGELYKHEVRALGKALGVPQPIIDRAPSPGLWPGQTDEGEMGITYAALDAILDAWDRGVEPDQPPESIAKVKAMVARSEHKRAMPPAFPVKRG